VLTAVKNVNSVLGPALIGKSETEQTLIDELMLKLDGTPNKVNMGANAILGISLAVAKAGAAARGVPLYQVGYLTLQYLSHHPTVYRNLQ
jgi:enolase